SRDTGDPFPRAGRRKGVHAPVEHDLPAGHRRAPAQGALSRLRLEDDRLRLLRLATVSPGERRGPHRDRLRRGPRLRGLRPLHRPAEAALAYTSMLVWNPEGVDDALWERLRAHFSEEEIVELGSFVCITFGQQRVIKTWGVGHGEF